MCAASRWLIDPEEIVGSGCFGIVYAVQKIPPVYGQKFVAKVLCLITVADRRRFREEIIATRKASSHNLGPKYYDWFCCRPNRVPWKPKNYQPKDGEIIHYPWDTLHWKEGRIVKNSKNMRSAVFGVLIMERIYLAPRSVIIKNKDSVIHLLKQALRKMFRLRLWHCDLFSGRNFGFLCKDRGENAPPQLELKIWDWGLVDRSRFHPDVQKCLIREVLSYYKLSI
jgi:hypothetical protein